MDNATIDAEINEKIQQLQDLNRQMGEITKKIGALQEEGRALHGAALEIKGGIEALAKLKQKNEEKLAKSKTAALILPEGVKPVVEETPAPTAPVAEELKAKADDAVKTDTVAPADAPVQLEVK